MRIARSSRRRRGTETIEFIATLAVVLAVTTAAISIFAAFANTLLAQHALSQTAIYVTANGRFTTAAQDRCLQMMPDSAGAGQVKCRLFRSDGSEVTPSQTVGETLPIAFGDPMTLQVEFQQPWFFLCLDGGCSNLASNVTLKVDLLSLTQQRTGR